MCHINTTSFSRALFIASLLCFTMLRPAVAHCQEPVPKTSPPASQEEVLRIETELVQTPVLVFDKQGRFIDNLKREQFELRIDGQPHPVTFFERVTAGSLKEAEQYEAARKGTTAPKRKPVLRPTSYGRTLIFFVDDHHLSSESTQRTREALLKFINNSMGQEDSGVITTATGQLGFLQQLTDNKDVLRLAAERLKNRQLSALDTESPPMSAYQATILERGSDEGMMRHFADITIKDQFQGMLLAISNMTNVAQKERMFEQLRRQAEQVVKQRARRILSQYSSVNQMTYRALENLMRATAQLPGSKLVILISDGFHLAGQSNELNRLNSVTDAAVRSGAVIYSIQASGLGTNMPDAKADVRVSAGLETGRAPLGEDTSIQAPLYTLAVDTGGRPLFNSNDMNDGIKKAIQETSEYYLLAWKPQTSAQRQPSFRKIQVTVSGRPDLTVRMQRGFLDNAGKPSADDSAKGTPPKDKPAGAPPTTQDAMQEALSATFPITDLPTSVAVSYMDFPKDGTKLITVTEVWSEVLFLDNAADTQPREIEVVGVVLNDEGKVSASFGERLTANAVAAPGQTAPPEQNVFHVARTLIKPGIYQIRVAARDAKSGRKGSSSQWLLVPDLSSKRLALGSLLIGEKALEIAKGDTKTDADQRARLSVNHHFSRNSRLRFLTHIYNASRGESGTDKPDLAVQIRIARNNENISTSPEMDVETVAVEDMERIPYAAQIKLGALSPGRYALIVSVTDRHAQKTTAQSVSFWVE
jgi:VWFA-related protein